MIAPDILFLLTSKDGSPWVRVPTKLSIELDTLIYSKDGSPWWGVDGADSEPPVDDFVPWICFM